ncbi:hypothetical protein [Chryseobacterium indologenes]|uniref:hypothetical protein n=1 Tax=Chryseobacterium indologenes TaxID=253 RepID=UPI003017E00D
MNKEELLKIYSAYLPYDLKIGFDGEDYEHSFVGLENSNEGVMLISPFGDFGRADIEKCKPILYDLSYLTKEIEHEGETFVPIKRIYEINGWEWDNEEGNEIDEIGICSDLNILTYATAQLLLSWHFNIFSLTEDQFINKATLKK